MLLRLVEYVGVVFGYSPMTCLLALLYLCFYMIFFVEFGGHHSDYTLSHKVGHSHFLFQGFP
jgi:hypothetical protein